jgi:phage major head subunit gpT-like protein
MSSLRSNFGDLLEPGFRQIFDDAFVEVPMTFPQIFKEETSSKQDERISGITGFGLLQVTGESDAVQYEDPVQMYDVTFVHQKYTKGFKVSEELVEDDQYNVIKGKPAQLARAARRTAENSGANVFNRAFSTSYLGGDGKPLASTTHPRSDGGSSQSNASSTGLTFTDDNLETARIAIRKQLDDKGMNVQIMPNVLLVPFNLEKDAKIVAGSSGRPGSADNDINVYDGMFKVLSWEYLTTTTGWFLIDQRQAQLMWFWRIKPEFKQDNAFDTGMALFKVRTRFSNGWADWRGVWGSKGDGQAYSS